jgi:hypothetical protein
MLLVPHRQIRHSVVPFIAGTAMPLAAAPYRASGLVLWHLADIAVWPNVRFAPKIGIGGSLVAWTAPLYRVRKYP